jgi:hypothetical protein
MPIVNPTKAFIDTLRYGSVLVLARFTPYAKGKPNGSPFLANVSQGTFTVDRHSAQRRTGQITIEFPPTIPPPALLPVNPTATLAPFGNEVFVETGITGNGNFKNAFWVPSGLFAIATSTVDDTSIDLVATLNVNDRSWTIAQRTLKQPYNFPATTGNFVDEVKALLNQVWNQQVGVAPLQFNIVPTNAMVPVASYNQGADPWQACLDMASAIGYELYFDPTGVVVGKPIPNPLTTAPSWNFTDSESAIIGLGGTGSTSLFGSAYSTPVAIQVQMTRAGIYNDIIVQGTGTANAATYTGTGIQTSGGLILAEASDQNPLSPTWVGGGMGDVPNFISSSLVTAAGGQPMANNELQQALSAAWSMTITSPPNPIFDIDDVVTVTRPRVAVSNLPMVIDTITHTFRFDDVMQITGRVVAPA